MTDQFVNTNKMVPITPPPELVKQWRTAPEYASALEKLTMVTMTDRRLQEIATQAARWGADEQLEMDATWVALQTSNQMSSKRLIAEMRPKPPSLKEQALDRCNDYIDPDGIIRRALESLPN